MLVISYGIPKSGSTLAFAMLTGALESAGHPQIFLRNDLIGPGEAGSRQPHNFMNEVSRERLLDLIAKIGPGRIVAIKTHAPLGVDMFRWLEEKQAARDIQVVASYRDPRDNCLSLMDAGERARERGKRAFAKIDGFQKAMDRVEKRLSAFRRWAALKGTLRLNYDDVAFDPEKVLDDFERVLGIAFDRAEVLRHAFEEAHTNRNKAKRHRYLDELDDDQKAQAAEFFREFIAHAIERDDQDYHDRFRDRVLELPPRARRERRNREAP